MANELGGQKTGIVVPAVATSQPQGGQSKAESVSQSNVQTVAKQGNSIAADLKQTAGNQAARSPRRGAIGADISTSTDLLVAGESFSLFVTIRNPFEVPVTLEHVSTFLPIEFIEDSHQEGKENAGSEARFSTKVARFFGPISLPIAGTGDGRIVYARGTGDGGSLRGGGEGAEGKGGQESNLSETLQPGNSTTLSFTMRSRRKMWFTPSIYKLEINVKYLIEERVADQVVSLCNLDTIEKTLQVRASLISIASGAVAGAGVGWIVKKSFEGEGFDWGAAAFHKFLINAAGLLATVLIAAMTVLFVARKKDAQPLVSVEDFWGGVVVGFLVAYSGERVFGPPK
jgi:hypothetical protein